MSTTLQEIRDEILGFVKRPLDDAYWVSIANKSINTALRHLQQKIPNFNALETIDNTITYTANSVTINLTDASSEEINKIMSVQRLYKAGNYTGKPLLVMDYTALQQNMLKFEQKQIPTQFENEEFDSYATYVSQVQGHVAYLQGTDLGLYPIPTQDILLAVHYTRYLPNLVNDTDTNVILQNCSEYVFYFSLRRLNVLLSEVDRITVSSSLLSEALSDSRAWNASLVHSNPIEL